MNNQCFGLIKAKEQIYDPMGFAVIDVVKSSESVEYDAHTFLLNEKRVIFRMAKITPTKIGQFVTFWKRINGVTAPYDAADNFDLFVVSVSNKDRIGQFVFSKEVLIKHGIVSVNQIGGKRAIRVYPAWDTPDNKQVKRTQIWQLNYFFEVDAHKDFTRGLYF